MDPLLQFESLAGVRPGDSTVGQVSARFGMPKVSKASDDGSWFRFEGVGVLVFVDCAQRDAADLIVDEVHLVPPNTDELPCGVHLGQPQTDALEAVRRSYRITDEYEDAIYFRPSARDDLLASVEFLDSGVVVSIELHISP